MGTKKRTSGLDSWVTSIWHTNFASPSVQLSAAALVIGAFIAIIFVTEADIVNVGIVIGYTSLGWVFRSVGRRTPDSWFFSITLFSLLTQIYIAGSWLLAPRDSPQSKDWIMEPREWILLSLIGLFLLALVHAMHYGRQKETLHEHLLEVLDRSFIGNPSERGSVVRYYADVGSEMMEVDFFPESIVNRIGPIREKERQRRKFWRALPPEVFKKDGGQTGSIGSTTPSTASASPSPVTAQSAEALSEAALLVPEETRRPSWRMFAFLGIFSFEILATNLRFYP